MRVTPAQLVEMEALIKPLIGSMQDPERAMCRLIALLVLEHGIDIGRAQGLDQGHDEGLAQGEEECHDPPPFPSSTP